MKAFFGHLNTILTHKKFVLRHARKIGITYRGLLHDMSKFSPVEFIPGVRFWANGKKSPNELQREKSGYSAAWLHHKGINKHHFEYWTDYNKKEKRVLPVKMPYVYLLEMLCDRLSASKVYQGENYIESHPLDYFLNGKEKRFIHPDTSDELERLLTMIKNKGEDFTFNYIKTNRKELEKNYNEGRSE